LDDWYQIWWQRISAGIFFTGSAERFLEPRRLERLCLSDHRLSRSSDRVRLFFLAEATVGPPNGCI
jgi:hypothetical protein